MPNYEIRAADENGRILNVTTTDTASLALLRLRDAGDCYRRIWVIDETGSDVPADVLLSRDLGERSID